MRRLAALSIVTLALSAAAASAACIGAAGQSLSGRVFEYSMEPKSDDRARFVRLSSGRATVDVRVIDRSDRVSRCQGDDRGLEFALSSTPGGAQIRCQRDDDEGPAAKLHCRVTIARTGKYYLNIRNPGCRVVEYALRCRNGHVAP